MKRSMSFTNERGQYGSRPRVPRIGAEARSSEPSEGFTIAPWMPWMIGAAGLAVVGLALFGAHAAATRPRSSPHEKEMRAWKAEFPGLPWFMDEVKDARQLDMWERARDHWERTH
jgi:hypothetical protein